MIAAHKLGLDMYISGFCISKPQLVHCNMPTLKIKPVYYELRM